MEGSVTEQTGLGSFDAQRGHTGGPSEGFVSHQQHTLDACPEGDWGGVGSGWGEAGLGGKGAAWGMSTTGMGGGPDEGVVDVEPLKCGWLRKCTSGGWGWRWFVLSQMNLCYYADPSVQKTLNFDGGRLHVDKGQEANELVVMCHQRTLFLRASSQCEAAQWIMAFQRVMQAFGGDWMHSLPESEHAAPSAGTVGQRPMPWSGSSPSGTKRVASAELHAGARQKMARASINWLLVKHLFECLLRHQYNPTIHSREMWQAVRNTLVRREEKAKKGNKKRGQRTRRQDEHGPRECEQNGCHERLPVPRECEQGHGTGQENVNSGQEHVNRTVVIAHAKEYTLTPTGEMVDRTYGKLYVHRDQVFDIFRQLYDLHTGNTAELEKSLTDTYANVRPNDVKLFLCAVYFSRKLGGVQELPNARCRFCAHVLTASACVCVYVCVCMCVCVFVCVCVSTSIHLSYTHEHTRAHTQVDADGSGTLDRMEFFKLVSDIKDDGHWSLENLTGKAQS